MKKKYGCLLLLCCFALTLIGCSDSGDNVVDETSVVTTADTTAAADDTQAVETGSVADTTVTDPQIDSCDDVGDLTDPEPDDDSEAQGILSQPSDIMLYDCDGCNTNFCFTYGDEVFSAVYTTDNWKIIDSYKIDVYSDMLIICQALIDVNAVHGSDMVSYRTADDMAYEWQQHNIAYSILPEDNAWRNNAKDVDLNPEDQGKSLYELYKARSGQE